MGVEEEGEGEVVVRVTELIAAEAVIANKQATRGMRLSVKVMGSVYRIAVALCGVRTCVAPWLSELALRSLRTMMRVMALVHAFALWPLAPPSGWPWPRLVPLLVRQNLMVLLVVLLPPSSSSSASDSQHYQYMTGCTTKPNLMATTPPRSAHASARPTSSSSPQA